jgi:hypothetical protein
MADGRSARYPTLDAMRGIALISMVASHVSLPGHPTTIDKLMHEPHWIDGAFYFVAISGVVAGLVHRRIVDRYGPAASARKLARRAGFIYLVQLGLVMATVTVASVRSSAQLFNTPTWDDLGGLIPGLWRMARLQVEPNFTGVLPMYVIFLLLAIPAVLAMRRGWWWAVAGGSLALYVVGKAIGRVTFATWAGSFDVLGWQLLFIAGLMTGWAWEHGLRAIPRRVQRAAVVGAAGTTALFFLLAQAAPGRTESVLGALLQKFPGGAMAFVYAAAALLTAYVVLDWLRRFRLARDVMAPLQILGVKGLPGYVAMVLTILFFATFPSLPRNELTVVVVVVVAGVSEWGAWKWATRPRKARTAAAPAARTGLVLPGVAPTPIVNDASA